MPEKLSRRDWFRLRIPHKNRMLDEKNLVPADDGPAERSINSVSAESNGLRPVELPPNHDGMDLAELPPMREATLSNEQVSALIADIGQLGTDILLMQRATGSQRADASRADSKVKLEQAEGLLLAGAIPRLQIRYRWKGQQWIDTLQRDADGFHIVRIAHQNS